MYRWLVQVLIGEMLQETEGMCEYAIYVLGEVEKIQ